MRKVVLVLLSCMLLSGTGCSLFGGGSKAGEEGMGDGNIPVATSGNELADVNYAFDSAKLDAQAQDKLRQNSRWLLDNPAVNVAVEGHCDERGTAEYNMALGQRRAEASADFLKSLGVKKERMSTISYGKELPLDPGHSEEAWAKNRRAHFSVKR